jgi:Na+/proline symporter
VIVAGTDAQRRTRDDALPQQASPERPVIGTLADIAGFAAVAAVLAWAARRRVQRDDAFLVADRAVGLFPLVATLVMTEFNTSTLLAFGAAGYVAGPMALALPLVFLVGLAFYTVTVARAWKRFNRLSVAEFFAARYSPALGRAASVLLLVAMTGFSATYVKSLTLIFAPLVAGVAPWLPQPVLALALSALVLALVLPGGLASVVRSDVVGFVVTVVLLPLLLLLGVRHGAAAGGLGAVFPADQLVVAPVAQWAHEALPFRFVVTLMVITCVTYIAAPWYGQKIFAARSERVAVAAVAWSAVLVFLLYGVVVLAAAHYRVAMPPLADPQTVVPSMIAAWLPAGLRGVGFATLLAAAVTTLAGVWSAMAAMVAADFGGRGAQHVTAQRRIVVSCAAISWLGGVTLVDDILNRLILANIPVAALAFALLAGFHWPRATTAGAWASMIVGTAWGVGCFVVVGEAGGYTWPWAMYGVPLVFATGVVVSLVDRRGVLA